MKILGIDYTYYLVCWGGAMVLYFKLKTDGRPVVEFLPHIIGNKANHWLARFADVLLFSIAGAFLGTILTSPTNAQQAVAAGLGWTGLLSSFAKVESS